MMADENDLPASGSEVIDSYGRKENLGGESEYSHTVRLAVRTPALSRQHGFESHTVAEKICTAFLDK